MIRVLLVDDHRLVRSGLTSLLGTAGDIEVVGEAADGAQAVTVVLELEPDVVLMDLSMPVMDGVSATRKILIDRPTTKIVMLSSFSDRARVRDAIAAGAIGYVLKDCTTEELLAAVRAAAQGHAPLDPRRRGAAADVGLCRARRADSATASGRCCGWPARAWRTSRSPDRSGSPSARSKVHLGNVFRRIGVSDRTSAALWARENMPELLE